MTYDQLKAAHARGEIIECDYHSKGWKVIEHPSWNHSYGARGYRVQQLEQLKTLIKLKIKDNK